MSRFTSSGPRDMAAAAGLASAGERGRASWPPDPGRRERRGAAEGPSRVGRLHSRRPGSAGARLRVRNVKTCSATATAAAALEELRRSGPTLLQRAELAKRPHLRRAGWAGRPRGGAARVGGTTPPEAAGAVGRRRAERAARGGRGRGALSQVSRATLLEAVGGRSVAAPMWAGRR